MRPTWLDKEVRFGEVAQVLAAIRDVLLIILLSIGLYGVLRYGKLFS